MILAANTTTSTAGIWAIVVVSVICLAFWLIMVVGVAARPDVKRRPARWTRPPASTPADEDGMAQSGPVMGGAHAAEGGRSVAPRRDAPAMAMAGAREADGPEAEQGAGGRPAEDTDMARDDMTKVPGPRSGAPFGMSTSAAYPAGTTPRTPQDIPDPGAYWPRKPDWARESGQHGVPGQRQSATDEAARSGQRDSERDRDQ